MDISVVQQFTVVLWGKKKAEGKTRLDEKGDKVNTDSLFISKIWRLDFHSRIFFSIGGCSPARTADVISQILNSE